MSKKFFWVRILGVIALAAPEVAFATTTNLQEIPTNWRLQDYIGVGLSIYATSAISACTTIPLTFPSGTTSDELNRFWSLVLTAKTTGAQVGIFYDSTTCLISSFYATP